MSIITQPLPSGAEIEGVLYRIHTDFRVWIQFETEMLESGEMVFDSPFNTARLLQLCYIDLPPTAEDAFRSILWFYSGGDQKGSSTGGKRKTAVYHFEHDAPYIYSAFLAQYGIDLQTADLHWWAFRALFRSLNDTNMIVKIMEYRGMDLSKIKDKEQKDFYRKMKKQYEIPHSKTEQDKLDEIQKALLNGGDLTGLL